MSGREHNVDAQLPTGCGSIIEPNTPRFRRETIALKVLGGPVAQGKLPKQDEWSQLGVAVHECGHAWLGHLIGEEPFLIVASADGKGYVAFSEYSEAAQDSDSPPLPSDTRWLDACALGATGVEDIAVWDLWIEPRRRRVEALVDRDWSLICSLAHQVVANGGRMDREGFRRWLDAMHYWRRSLGRAAVPARGALLPLLE